MQQPISLFLDEAKALSAEAVKSVYAVDEKTVEQVKTMVNFSPQPELAHAALPCHSLSKVLRKSPKEIATQLCQHISNAKHPRIKEVRELNGYLNFIFDLDLALQEDFKLTRSKQLHVGPILPVAEREKMIVEFSQPNTHKALHIGHLRNAVYGDAVCNLLAAIGHDVVRATYPGDMGAHIAKALWYMKEFKSAEIPTTPNPHWLGQIYSESDQYIKSIAGTDKEIEFKKDITSVFQELENQKGPFYDLYLTTREWSLQEMRDIYEWLGIKFDVWFFESECDHPSRELVQQKYKEGFFVLNQGAIGLDLNSYDLGFALYLRTDGTGLYLTKDLELIRRKFSDPKSLVPFTSSIHVKNCIFSNSLKQRNSWATLRRKNLFT